VAGGAGPERSGLAAPAPAGLAYQGFISYSHAADGRLAPSLQRGLQRFAKPWYQARALRIFRDNASMSVNANLWRTIEEALDNSEYYILLGSPEGAASEWVARQVQRWRETNPAAPLLIALTAVFFGPRVTFLALLGVAAVWLMSGGPPPVKSNVRTVSVSIAPQIRAGDVVSGPYARASTAPIVDSDISAVAANALLEKFRAAAATKLGVAAGELRIVEGVATAPDGRKVELAEVAGDNLVVDGVYSADPKKNKNAKHFAKLSYHEVLVRDLKVMDASAISLARENQIPILVFSLRENNSIASAVCGKGKFTLITDKK